MTGPLFVAPGAGAGPEWMSIKAGAAGTGGTLGVAEGLIPAGHSPSLHVHREEDEAFYVLTGMVDIVCGDERFRAEAGAFAFLPRGLPHTFIGIAEPASRVLLLLAPAGLEELFLATDAEQTHAILMAHGVEIVGPPLDASGITQPPRGEGPGAMPVFVLRVMRLARDPRARKLLDQAHQVARSPQAKKVLAQAQKAARDPRNRRRLAQLRARARKLR
jgi:mannose-6-phosphate isomerase-like protein (cupin superfamily)